MIRDEFELLSRQMKALEEIAANTGRIADALTAPAPKVTTETKGGFNVGETVAFTKPIVDALIASYAKAKASTKR